MQILAFCLRVILGGAAVVRADSLPWHPSSYSVTLSALPASTTEFRVAAMQSLDTVADPELLDLRQAPPPVPAPAPVNPAALPNANNPAEPAAAAPPVNPAVPARPAAPPPPAAVLTTTTPSLTTPPMPTETWPVGEAFDSTTVQWVETWIGGTAQTWVPRTIVFHFPAHATRVPQPGKGEVGMGSLTGRVGVTQTLVMGSGARATAGAGGEGRGVLAVVVGVGVGIAGGVF